MDPTPGAEPLTNGPRFVLDVSRAAAPFRRDIEGLRGIAILLVVGYHAGLPMLSGGYVGVDAFFVLSGFLITGLLTRELTETGRINFVDFYARRARRLLPAAALVLLCTLALGYWLLPPVEQLRYTGTAIAAALYVSNFWFAKESTNYLAPNSHFNPFLHTWSLSVEEQFYLVWPCALLLVATGEERRRHGRLRAAMLVIFAVSLAASLWLTQAQQPQAFFGSPTRSWEFAAGGLATFVTVRRRWATIAPWVGAGAVFLGASFFSDATPYPGLAALVPVTGTRCPAPGGSFVVDDETAGGPVASVGWAGLLFLVPVALACADLRPSNLRLRFEDRRRVTSGILLRPGARDVQRA